MSGRFLRAVWVAFLALLISVGFASDDPVKWSASLDSATPKPGQRVQVVLKATIEKGWHLYSTTPITDGPFPTSIKLDKSAAVSEVGKPAQQTPIKQLDPNFGKDVEFYAETAEFRIPARLAKTASGTIKLNAVVDYQVCNDRTCQVPKTKSVPLEVAVSGAAVDDPGPLVASVAAGTAATESSTQPSAPAPKKNAVDKAKSQGLFAFLALAVVNGLLALLTPCVFPMIPITVSFFSKKAKDQGVKGAAKHALAYCLGIVGTFTAIGVIVAVAFGATGIQAFANNPWLNLILTVVFVALAFSLFGVFELGIPSSLLSKIDGGGKSGFVGPVLMGLTFSLTSFTCTLPFVGTILVSASQGDILWPILGMIGFSGAFAAPFFLLALFPSYLSSLPKSGSWLAIVKAFMGFIELAAAVKFLSSVDLGIVPGGLGFVTREVYLALWFGIVFCLALWLLGAIRLPHVDENKIGWVRRGVGVLTLFAAYSVLASINGKSLGQLEAFLPPSPYPGKSTNGAATGEKLAWLTNYDEAVAKAKAENKPLFIDFTGIYCTNCRAMEKNMFPRPGIESKLEKYVRVRLFTDRRTPEDNKNQVLMLKLTRSATLPNYVAQSVDGKVETAAYTNDESEFSGFLSKGLGTLTASR